MLRLGREQHYETLAGDLALDEEVLRGPFPSRDEAAADKPHRYGDGSGAVGRTFSSPAIRSLWSKYRVHDG